MEVQKAIETILMTIMPLFMVMTKRREQLDSTSNHLNDNVGLAPEVTVLEWSLRHQQLEKIGWLRCLIIERESPKLHIGAGHQVVHI